MKDLGRRLVVSSLVIALVVLLLVFATTPPIPYVIAGVIALLAAVAIWEYAQFALAKGAQLAVPVLVAGGALVALSFPVGLQIPTFAAAFLGLFASHFRRIEGAIVSLAASTFGLVYIALPLGMLLSILHHRGAEWIAYLLVVTKITDIGAYFGGSLFGKRPLAPLISPKKTVEGALCGLLCAIIASLAFHFTSLSVGLTQSLILGVLLGVLAQFSDLAESLLKRDAHKKDSNSLPGLGGVLDFLDSLLFSAPMLYIYLEYLVP